MPRTGEVIVRPRWPWLSLLPLALGAWAPIYAGVRAGVRRWTVWGAGWSALAVAGWIAAVSDHGKGGLGGFLLIVAWVGAIATSFTIRAAYAQRTGSAMVTAEEQAQQRLADRARARALATSNPDLAQEMGIGRPDAPGGYDAGLIDINNAAITALLRLPGVTGEVATQIVESRAACGGFTSVEDLGLALDLPGDLVEQLRPAVVFLPRRATA